MNIAKNSNYNSYRHFVCSFTLHEKSIVDGSGSFGRFGGASCIRSRVVVQMNLLTEQGIGKGIGTVTISEGLAGLVFTPELIDLAPSVHGFHVHQNADRAAGMKDGKMVSGLAAGGHYDPANVAKHEGPHGKGHLGDLLSLTVGADGKAVTAVTAPRLKMADVKGRSL